MKPQKKGYPENVELSYLILNLGAFIKPNLLGGYLWKYSEHRYTN